MCVVYHSPIVICWSSNQLLLYRKSSELAVINLQVELRPLIYTTHQDSEATTLQITSCTYLLLGDQELLIKRLLICLAVPRTLSQAFLVVSRIC